MHFWIDKRSQCAYTGRHRVASTLSAGRARGRVCVGGAGGARKGMAAPVHRFASVDCAPRRPVRAARHYPSPPIPSVHNPSRRQNEDSIYVEIPLEPPPTIASLAAARSVTPDTLLRTAALGLHHHSPMMAPHLKFGIMVSFALATMFLAAAKYYFDRQVGVIRDNSSGSEASIVCAAVACVCGVGCALSMCRAAPPPPRPPERVSSTARRPPAPAAPPRALLADRQQSEPSDMSVSVGLQGAGSPEAPPPYKIAVLMPGREPQPPAYSELS